MAVIPPHTSSSAAAPAQRIADSKAFPSRRLSTPGGTAYSRPRPRMGQTSPIRNTSWWHATRSAPAYASVPCRHRPGVMVPLVGMTDAPCPDDAAGVLRIASPWGDPPGTAGLRTVAAAPKSIVRKYFRLILASCNATLSQKISADHLRHDPTVLDTHPAAFHPLDQDLPFFRPQRDAWRWLRHAPPLVQHHGM